MEFILDALGMQDEKENSQVYAYDLALEYAYHCVENDLYDSVYVLYKRKSIPYRFLSVRHRAHGILKRIHTKFIISEEKLLRFIKLSDLFLCDLRLLIIVHKLDDFLSSDSEQERSEKVLRLNHLNIQSPGLKVLFVYKLDSFVIKENSSNLLLYTSIGSSSYAVFQDSNKAVQIGYIQCFKSKTYSNSYEVVLRQKDTKGDSIVDLKGFVSLYIE